MCNISIGKYLHAVLILWLHSTGKLRIISALVECDRKDSEEHLNQLSDLQHNHHDIEVEGASD